MLTEVHEAAQEWTHRAAVAIRSRISLVELEELVQKGDAMPVNVSDLLEKLRSRVLLAHCWVKRLRNVLRVSGNDDPSTIVEMKWFSMMRKVLNGDDDERASELHDLAIEGSRILVEIVEHRYLQIEIDARNWGMRARKILEKKGKIAELREHLSRGGTIRARIRIDIEKRDAWTLDYEAELLAVVDKADAWHKQVSMNVLFTRS